MPPNAVNTAPELTPPASVVRTQAFARALSDRPLAFTPRGAAPLGARGRDAVSLAQSLTARTRISMLQDRFDWLTRLLGRFSPAGWAFETPDLYYFHRPLRKAEDVSGSASFASAIAHPSARQTLFPAALSPALTAMTATAATNVTAAAQRPVRESLAPSPEMAFARGRRSRPAESDAEGPRRRSELPPSRPFIPLLPSTLNSTHALQAVLQLHTQTAQAKPAAWTEPSVMRHAFPERLAEAVARRSAGPARRTSGPAPDREAAELPMPLSYPPVPLASWLGVAASAPEQAAWENAPGFGRATFNPAGSYLLALPTLAAAPLSQPHFERQSEAAFAALPKIGSRPTPRFVTEEASAAVRGARALATHPTRPALEKPAPPSVVTVGTTSPPNVAGREPSGDAGEEPAAARRSPLKAAQTALEFLQRFATRETLHSAAVSIRERMGLAPALPNRQTAFVDSLPRLLSLPRPRPTGQPAEPGAEAQHDTRLPAFAAQIIARRIELQTASAAGLQTPDRRAVSESQAVFVPLDGRAAAIYPWATDLPLPRMARPARSRQAAMDEDTPRASLGPSPMRSEPLIRPASTARDDQPLPTTLAAAVALRVASLAQNIAPRLPAGPVPPGNTPGRVSAPEPLSSLLGLALPRRRQLEAAGSAWSQPAAVVTPGHDAIRRPLTPTSAAFASPPFGGRPLGAKAPLGFGTPETQSPFYRRETLLSLPSAFRKRPGVTEETGASLSPDKAGKAASVSPAASVVPAPRQPLYANLTAALVTRYSEPLRPQTAASAGIASRRPAESAAETSRTPAFFSALAAPLLRFLRVVDRKQVESSLPWVGETPARSAGPSAATGPRLVSTLAEFARSRHTQQGIAGTVVPPPPAESPLRRLLSPAILSIARLARPPASEGVTGAQTPGRAYNTDVSLAAQVVAALANGSPVLQRILSRRALTPTLATVGSLPLPVNRMAASSTRGADAETPGRSTDETLAAQVAALSSGSPTLRRFLSRWTQSISPTVAHVSQDWSGELALPTRLAGSFGSALPTPSPAAGPMLLQRFAVPDVHQDARRSAALPRTANRTPPRSAGQTATDEFATDETGFGIDEAAFADAVGEAAARTVQAQLLSPIREFLLATLSRFFAPVGTGLPFADAPLSNETPRSSPASPAADLGWMPRLSGPSGREATDGDRPWGVPALPMLSLPSLDAFAPPTAVIAEAFGAQRRSATTGQRIPGVSPRADAAPMEALRPRIWPRWLRESRPERDRPTPFAEMSPLAAPRFAGLAPAASAESNTGTARIADAYGETEPWSDRALMEFPRPQPLEALLARSTRLTTQDLPLPQRLAAQMNRQEETDTHSGDPHAVARALTSLPVRAVPMRQAALGTQAFSPTGRGAGALMERALEMPLPLRPGFAEGATSAAILDPLLIQRAVEGNVSTPSQSSASHGQSSAEDQSGGNGHDVDDMAKQVWSRIRRRLANEASRAGHW